jgi:hypothetical protein
VLPKAWGFSEGNVLLAQVELMLGAAVSEWLCRAMVLNPDHHKAMKWLKRMLSVSVGLLACMSRWDAGGETAFGESRSRQRMPSEMLIP